MKSTPLTAFMAGVMSISLVLPAVAQTFNGRQLQGSVTYVPVGTTLDASLTSPIDSAVSRAGDLFSARLNQPLFMGSDLVLPSATTLEGTVTAANKSGHAGSNGVVGLHLTGAVTPDGIRYPLSANITTAQAKDPSIHEDKQGNLKGRTNSATVKSGLIRAALWTPIVGGAVGAGAIAGVASGGAIGLGSNLWRKGKDVAVPSGTRIQFALDQPMAVSAVSGSVASAGSLNNPPGGYPAPAGTPSYPGSAGAPNSPAYSSYSTATPPAPSAIAQQGRSAGM
jgi:hypothetical protein